MSSYWGWVMLIMVGVGDACHAQCNMDTTPPEARSAPLRLQLRVSLLESLEASGGAVVVHEGWLQQINSRRNTMTTNAVSRFTFDTLYFHPAGGSDRITKDIRVVQLDGAPWFVAMDIYQSLGLAQWGGILNPLDDSEKMLLKKHSGLASGLFTGRVVHITLISESGLYKLIMRSDKPQAKEFQNWVTKVVLPAIRKDGGYVAGEEKVVEWGQFVSFSPVHRRRPHYAQQ